VLLPIAGVRGETNARRTHAPVDRGTRQATLGAQAILVCFVAENSLEEGDVRLLTTTQNRDVLAQIADSLPIRR
jgi:hypothetical protein